MKKYMILLLLLSASTINCQGQSCLYRNSKGEKVKIYKDPMDRCSDSVHLRGDTYKLLTSHEIE
jgi:hypothetical protein